MPSETGATFTSTITESVTLNGSVRGSTNTVTFTTINNVEEKIINCAYETTRIATFADDITNVGGEIAYPALYLSNCEYLRVTNLDDTVPIEVAFVTTDATLCEGYETADSYRILLEAGQSHILWTIVQGKLGAATAPNYALQMTNLQYIEVYNADEETAVDVELMVVME